MPLKFRCVCGQALIVSRKFAGRSVRCPKCDTKLRVPQPRSYVTLSTKEGPADVNNSVAADRPREAIAPPEPQPPEPAAHPFQARATLPPPSPFTPAPTSNAVDRMRAIVTPVTAPKSTAVPPPVPPEVAIDPPTQGSEVSDTEASATNVRGYEPPSRLVSTVSMLAMGLAFVACFGAGPAVYDVVEHLRTPDSPGVATRAYAILLLTVLQFAYAAYLWQLPDWSSVWVVTVVTLSLAVVYAMLLATTYLSQNDGWFVQLLQLSDKLRGGQAAGWCFIMLCLMSLLSYLSGRISVRWSQAAL